MSMFSSSVKPKSVTWTGIVTRCGCSNLEKAAPDWHGLRNEVCSKPQAIKDLGIISYSSSNWFKNTAFKLKQLFF